MIKGRLHRTIHFEFMIALIITALVPAMLINFFYYNRVNKFTRDKIQSYNSEIIKQAGQKIDFLLSEMEITRRQLIATAITSELFANYDGKSEMEKLDIVRKTEGVLNNIKQSYPGISDIYMIGFDKHVFSTNSNCNRELLLKKEWIRDIRKKTYGEVTVPPHHADYTNINIDLNTAPNNNYVISFLSKITSYGDNTAIGIIQIDLNYNEIKEIMKSINISEKSYLTISDKSNKIIYCDDAKYLGKDIGSINNHYKNSYGFTTTYDIQDVGWRLTGLISPESSEIALKEANKLLLLIILLLILFSFFISYILAKGITRPIGKIIKTMKRVGGGEFNIMVPESNNQDLQILYNSFNSMIDKINNLMKSAIENEKAKTAAEMNALQAQINPHFLYNTLNTIKWMAIVQKSDDIANAIVSVVKILEFTFRDSEKLITVSKDMEFLTNYINIQKLRYGSNFEIRYDLNEEILNLYIMRFVLQPILENSIIHGFSKKDYNGIITVKGVRQNSDVVFEVIDNGVGMETNMGEKFTGLGIKNVDDRIKLNFGREYGLNLESILGEGTRVMIRMPAIEKAEFN